MRRLVPLLTVLVLALTLLPGSAAAPRAAEAATARRVAAWLPYWDQDRGYQQILANSDLYSEVSPFWYEMQSASSVTAYAGGESATVTSGLRSRGIKVIPTVTNDFDPARVTAMLATAATRATHIQTLTTLVTSKGYDGIDLDYEALAAADRDRFSAFAGEAAAALHAAGKTLSMTLHPKTEEPGSWNGPQAQDYAAIGLAADRVRIMAYDFHWATSAAGPVAPIGWVDDVAAFAASQIAPAKVQLGMPFYGYDWVGTNGEGVTFETANARRASAGAARRWSSVEAAPWFTYASNGTTHTVWYEDAQSIAAKLPLVDTHGLAGPVFWRLGGEDPAIWTEVRNRYSGTTPPADTTAPTVPSGLKAAPARRAITLTWNASTDAGGSGLAGYEVFRATSAAGPFTKIATVTGRSYKNANLPRRTSYWYQVKAYDGASNRSGSSATVTARTT